MITDKIRIDSHVNNSIKNKSKPKFYKFDMYKKTFLYDKIPAAVFA